MAHDKPISWEQGLFLQPQHFQLSDIYHDYKLTTLSRMLMPYLWGAENIRIDMALFANQIFSIEQGRILMPDGTVIEVPTNTMFMSRAFGKDMANKDELLVYAGIKTLQTSSSNATNVQNLEAKDIDTRFVSLNQQTEVNDIYFSGPKVGVKSLQYAMRLFWDTEIANVQNYALLPIAKVIRKGDQLVLDTNFIAPCLDIKASKNLHAKLEDLYNMLMERTKTLERYKHNWNTYDGDRNVQENLQLLQTLARYVTELHQLFSASNMHPFSCYRLLASLVAELSVFTPEINVIGEDKLGNLLMPAYQHNNLSATFEGVFKLISSTLDSMLLGTQNMVAAPWQDRYYVGSPSDKFFRANTNFYLLVKMSDANQLDTIQQTISAQAKLCAYSEIDSTLEHAVAGIKITLLSTVPNGVPNINDCLYYSIDSTSSQWQKASQELKVAFYIGSNDSNLTVHFAGNEA